MPCLLIISKKCEISASILKQNLLYAAHAVNFSMILIRPF